jgi:hypothetical protein
MSTKEIAMRERHRIRKFTPEQMELLAANPFTHKINVHRISYTLEFKNLFLARYESGEAVKAIFSSLGYDTAVLGENRIYGFAKRLVDQAEAGEMPTEERSKSKLEKPVNVDYNTMPAQQSVSAMQREIAYLRQQIEFLKKITELDSSRKSSN